jgi:hypothetical protein
MWCLAGASALQDPLLRRLPVGLSVVVPMGSLVALIVCVARTI